MRNHVASKHPDCPDLLVIILSTDGIDIQKILAHSVWTTDTLYAVTLVCKMDVEKFGNGLLQQECHNHLQNLWVGGLEKELSSYLTNILISILDEIDPTLRVKNLFSALACAYDKGFSISDNYPKGFGGLFIEWMMDKHRGYVLYHVDRVQCYRKDIILEA